MNHQQDQLGCGLREFFNNILQINYRSFNPRAALLADRQEAAHVRWGWSPVAADELARTTTRRAARCASRCVTSGDACIHVHATYMCMVQSRSVGCYLRPLRKVVRVMQGHASSKAKEAGTGASRCGKHVRLLAYHSSSCKSGTHPKELLSSSHSVKHFRFLTGMTVKM